MPAKTLTLLGINGSTSDGATDHLLREMLGRCPLVLTKNRRWRKVDMQVEIIGLELSPWNLPLFFRGHEPTDTISNILEKMKTADGIILASPVHWFTMSTAMKNLLDWCVLLEDGWPLNGKPVGFGACGDTDGGQATLNAMAQVMAHLECVIPQNAMCFFRNTTITRLKNLEDCEQRWMLTDAPLVGMRVAEAALKNKFGQ